MTSNLATKRKPGKRGRPPATSDGQSNRQLILEAALVEFALHGYEGTKIADIAKRASVVTPAVHYHFKTKDQLWKATMENSFGELRNRQISDIEAGDLQDLDDLSKLRVTTRRYIRFAFARPHHARIVFMETSRDTDRAKWLIDNFLAAIHMRDRDLFKRLVENKKIKPYPQLTFLSMMAGAVMVIISNVTSVGHLYDMSATDEKIWKEQEDIIVDVLIEGFLYKD